MCPAKTLGWGAGKGPEPVAPGLGPGPEEENLLDTQSFHLGEEPPNWTARCCEITTLLFLLGDSYQRHKTDIPHPPTPAPRRLARQERLGTSSINGVGKGCIDRGLWSSIFKSNRSELENYYLKQ